MFKTKYRITTSNYKVYAVERKYWWFPFWHLYSTYFSIGAAEKVIELLKKGSIKKVLKVYD